MGLIGFQSIGFHLQVFCYVDSRLNVIQSGRKHGVRVLKNTHTALNRLTLGMHPRWYRFLQYTCSILAACSQ